jgi:autotransporter-associated beta strand protein
MLCIGVAIGCLASQANAQQRVLGIDVSAWQGDISQTTWNNLHNVDDQDFVFIRSSRGGTTGFYNQSDPNNNNNQNTLSQRYDDPYFAQNITRATDAGLLAGPYHFARPDVIASTQNSGGIANTGADEADHFLQMAGAWMRPGYLLPVFDLEAGQAQRTSNGLAQFSIDFSDRIYEVTGVRPAIYTNGNYANDLQLASPSLRNAVVDAFPVLWAARWPNQSNPGAIPVQAAHPKDSYTPIYGPWDDPPQPTHPWSFWQYASTGRLSSYNNGNSNLDVNVAQGGLEFLKDHLVPALWTTDSDGMWNNLDNWNSGQAPVAPVQGPGQVPRVGRLSLPSVRLPGPNDTVILDRPGTEVGVTLDSGDHEIRKLYVHEPLHISGGSLLVNYVPAADSTSFAAKFSAGVSLSGGSLEVHTLTVDAGQTFSLGSALTFHSIELAPHATNPARVEVTGDVQWNPRGDATATITNGAGGGSTGVVDLGGIQRTWDVADGGAVVDLQLAVPVINGGLTKTGAGKLVLGGTTSYDGDTVVEQGALGLATAWLSNTSDVYLSTGAALELGFSGSPDVIDSLFIDGISQPVGVWGAIGTAAQYTSPLIVGPGLLQVSTATASIPGDFNGDGVVNSLDHEQWQIDFAVNGNSDADSDGDSDGRDLLIWQQNVAANAIANANAHSSAIPEPSTWALWATGAIAAGARCGSGRKRKR